jgi:hypothetical protein
VKWAERWMARAQRKADLRDERFRCHREGVRAGAWRKVSARRPVHAATTSMLYVLAGFGPGCTLEAARIGRWLCCPAPPARRRVAVQAIQALKLAFLPFLFLADIIAFRYGCGLTESGPGVSSSERKGGAVMPDPIPAPSADR